MALSVISFKSAEGSPSESEYGRVVELVDSLDSGSSVHCGRAGSSPASPTKKASKSKGFGAFFCFIAKYPVRKYPPGGLTQVAPMQYNVQEKF